MIPKPNYVCKMAKVIPECAKLNLSLKIWSCSRLVFKIDNTCPKKVSHVKNGITRETLTIQEKLIFEKLMHMVNCSNYFDANRTFSSRSWGLRKKIDIFCKFANEFKHNLSITLVQNISVLGKLRKLVSCVKVDHENKKQILFNPSISFFIDTRGFLY